MFNLRVSYESMLASCAIATIFISGLYLVTPFGIFFFSYILMAVTYILMMRKVSRTGLRVEYGWLFLVVFLSSLFGVVVTSAEGSLDYFKLIAFTSKTFLLIFFLAYYTLIYDLCGGIRKFFDAYVYVAIFFAAVGVFQQAVFVIFDVDILSSLIGGSKQFDGFLGVSAFSVEPAFYACALLPAGAYYISEFVRYFKLHPGGILVVLAIMCSTSSLGYLGLFISALLSCVIGVSRRRVWMICLSIPLVIVLAYKASSFEFFQLRWNDSVDLLKGAELTMDGGMNMSTYSNAVNASIAVRSFVDNYGLGVGFGMYSAAFDKYINDYEVPAYRDELPGRGSATSLLYRLTAELGILGLVFIMFLFKCLWAGSKGRLASINIGYFSTFIIILLRMGEYFANGVILTIVVIYLMRDRRSSVE